MAAYVCVCNIYRLVGRAIVCTSQCSRFQFACRSACPSGSTFAIVAGNCGGNGSRFANANVGIVNTQCSLRSWVNSDGCIVFAITFRIFNIHMNIVFRFGIHRRSSECRSLGTCSRTESGSCSISRPSYSIFVGIFYRYFGMATNTKFICNNIDLRFQFIVHNYCNVSRLTFATFK